MRALLPPGRHGGRCLGRPGALSRSVDLAGQRGRGPEHGRQHLADRRLPRRRLGRQLRRPGRRSQPREGAGHHEGLAHRQLRRPGPDPDAGPEGGLPAGPGRGQPAGGRAGPALGPHGLARRAGLADAPPAVCRRCRACQGQAPGDPGQRRHPGGGRGHGPEPEPAAGLAGVQPGAHPVPGLAGRRGHELAGPGLAGATPGRLHRRHPRRHPATGGAERIAELRGPAQCLLNSGSGAIPGPRARPATASARAATCRCIGDAPSAWPGASSAWPGASACPTSSTAHRCSAAPTWVAGWHAGIGSIGRTRPCWSWTSAPGMAGPGARSRKPRSMPGWQTSPTMRPVAVKAWQRCWFARRTGGRAPDAWSSAMAAGCWRDAGGLSRASGCQSRRSTHVLCVDTS
eukprot:Opistho-2@13405